MIGGLACKWGVGKSSKTTNREGRGGRLFGTQKYICASQNAEPQN